MIAAIVGVIGTCYLVELFYANPDSARSAAHAVVAAVRGHGVGAARGRHPRRDGDAARDLPALGADAGPDRRRGRRGARGGCCATRGSTCDRDGDRRADQPLDARDGRERRSGTSGLPNVDSLESAHETLEPILGSAASALFAIALLGSGLSSSAVGTLAGQVVMQGFVRRRIPIWVRRVVTMAAGVRRRRDRRRPVAHARALPGRALVRDPVRARSRSCCSRRRRDLMGALVNRRVTTVAAVGRRGRDHRLNVFLLAQTFGLALELAALQIAERVDRVAVDAHLEVQVRAGASGRCSRRSRSPGPGSPCWPHETAIDDWWPYAVARSPPWSITTRLP